MPSAPAPLQHNSVMTYIYGRWGRRVAAEVLAGTTKRCRPRARAALGIQAGSIGGPIAWPPEQVPAPHHRSSQVLRPWSEARAANRSCDHVSRCRTEWGGVTTQGRRQRRSCRTRSGAPYTITYNVHAGMHLFLSSRIVPGLPPIHGGLSRWTPSNSRRHDMIMGAKRRRSMASTSHLPAAASAGVYLTR